MTTISLLYNNIRGGRVFKSGKFVMTASALGFMMAVSAEAGSCLEQSTGSGNFTCSGAAVTTDSTQNLVTTASQIDVSVENGFGLSTVAQNGINISAGNKNISYLDNTGSSITAERNGLIFSTSGSIDVETNGDITVTSRDSINLNSGAAGNVASLSLVSTGDLSGTRSILTRNQGNGTSDVTIGGDLTINSGGNGHVLTRNDGGDQTFTLQEGSSMTGGTFGALVLHGVNNTGAPFGNATGDTTVVLDGDIDVDYYALWLNSSPTTDSVYISGSGDFSTESIGILVENQGTGETVFSNTGQITSNSDTAITISNTTNASGDISVSVNDVSGEVSAVTVNNRGAGNVNVTAAGSLTSGQNGPGTIYINNESGSDVTIDLLSGSSVSGNYAIYETDGDAVVNIASGATVNGNVSLGAGNDTLNLLDYDNTNILDGGTDTNTISLGGTSSLDGVNLLNWQAVSLLATSDISLTNLSIPSFALGASCGGTTEISGNSTLSSVQGCEGTEEIRISDNSNIDTVEGAGGTDIIDVSGNSQIQVLSGGGDGQDMSSSLDGADIINVAGNAFVDTITGDLGNDTITISENATINFTRGGVGNDSINVSGSGQFSWISGDEVDLSEINGDDIIIVDADFLYLVGDSTDLPIGHDGGNDEIVVNGSGSSSFVFGDGQNINTGGRDTITINDGSFQDLDGDGGSVSQGGDDEIIINGGYVANISGDGQVTNIGGQDTITVNTGDVSIIAGDDKFSDYDYRPQYTDPDADIITTKVYGNDEINVNGGNVYTIHGDAMRVFRTDGIADGDDTINVSGGYVSQIYGDTDHALAVGGHDILNISGGAVDLALMMDGNDTINVTDGSIADVQMGNGDDAGSWSGGNLTSYSGGDGSDSLVISSAVDMSASTIDGGDDASSADGMIDTLTISGTSAQVNGNNITNWEVLGFDDGADVIISSLSIENINASCGGDTELTTGVVTGSVNGCVGDEGITISGDASVGILEAAGGADTITLLDDAHVTSLNSGGDGQDGSDAQDAGDTLILASGTVDNDVMTELGNDTVNLSGTDIGGLLNTGSGADEVSMYDGSVNSIMTESGDDNVSLSGGSVDTDVLTGDGADSVVLNGIEMSGIVDTGADDDSVTMSDGRVAGIATDSGSDQVAISGGEAGPISTGTGQDKVLIYEGVVSNIDTGADADEMNLFGGAVNGDVITDAGSDRVVVSGSKVAGVVDTGADEDAVIISGGSVSEIITADGADVASVSGGIIGTLNMGTDNDTVRLSGGSVSELISGQGDDSIAMTDGDVENLNSGEGEDVLVLAGGSLTDVTSGDGADNIFLNGSTVSGSLISDGGNDSISVLSGSVTSVDTGSDDDFISLVGGDVGTMSAGAGDDSLSWEVGSVNNIDMGAGNDHGSVSHNNIGTAVINGGDDTDTLNISGTDFSVDASDVLNWESITFDPSSTVSVRSLVVPRVQASCGGNTTLTDGSSVSEFSGCDEPDTMSLLNGSEAGAINGLGGDDYISVISSTAGVISSDEGDDLITISRGVVGTVNSGTGSDVINMSSSTVSDVDSGEGADIVVATGSVVDVINTGADEDAVLISGSTVYDLVSGDGDDRVNVAGISDVSSLESGSGNDAIALTGGVVKSVDAGSGDDALILSGSDVVNINMGAGNDGVTVNSGSAQVILTGSGDDSVSWNDGEVGTLSMGAGSDSLIVDNSNQSVSGVVLDGGDDMSTADGMIDRLTLRNGGAVDGSDLLNWELVELSGGDFTNAGPAINAGDNTMGTGLLIRDASFDMGDSAVINGDLLLADTGLLIATGSGSGVYDVNGIFSAKGTVNMSDGQAGDVINVTGDYVLGGTVISDVDLTRGNADMISISGDAVGLGPSVVDLNLIGAVDGELSIDLITVDGKTDTSDFVLSDDIVGGAYDYSLSLDGGTWSLGRDYLTQVAVYETIPSLIGVTIRAETYHQRVGNRTWFSQSDAEGVWMKVYGENSSVTPDSSTEVTSYDLNSSSIQIGADNLLMETEHGTLIGGAVLSYDRASVETGDLSAEVDGYGVMGTLTYADISGAYVDAQLKVSNGSMDIYGVNGVDTSARMFSVEGGRKFETGHGWTVTPQAQITFASVDFDDFTGQDGEVVSDEDGESTNLRVGASAQRGWENANGDFGTFYMTGNLHKTIDGYVSVDVSGSEIRMSNDGLSAEIGVGGSYTWDKGRSTIYGEVSGYKGISGADLSGAKADIGLRIRF